MKDKIKTAINKMPMRLKKIISGCLFIACACYCMYLLLTAFTVQHGPAMVFKSIQTPGHITSTGEEHIRAVVIVSEHEFIQIEAFKNQIDSLRKTPGGNTIADSILQGRPGLMDSIGQLELLYHQQKTNSQWNSKPNH